PEAGNRAKGASKRDQQIFLHSSFLLFRALHDTTDRSVVSVNHKLLWELRAINSATEIPVRSHQHSVSEAVQRRIPSPQPAEHRLASKYKHVFTNPHRSGP